jgi:putative ABC transport system permease protein
VITATTWARLRADAGRLTAAGIAIVLGTGFAAAVLMANGIVERTAYASVTAGLAGADVVVTGGDDGGTFVPIADGDAEAVGGLEGVRVAATATSTYAWIVNGARSDVVEVSDLPVVPGLRTPEPTEGRLATAEGEIAVSESVAERLRTEVGDEIAVQLYVMDATDPQAQPEVVEDPLQVVGIVPGGLASSLGSSGAALVTAETTREWDRVQDFDGGPQQLLVVAEEGVTAEELRDRVAEALPGTTVRTSDEQAQENISELLDGVDILTGMALGFAALALFVAGFVITNTFAVLVAQRTRQLALLRCVGATKGQVRREVLGQAAVLGFLASLVGIALGTALATVGAALVASSQPQLDLPSTAWPDALAVLVPVVAGVLVTVGAALAPARAATRVSPLAALRPADGPDLRRRASWLRATLAIGLLALGALGLAGGLAISGSGEPLGALVAALGGGVSFVGVLVGALFVVPSMVTGAGALLARLVPGDAGAAVRLAAVNGVRNPRRTTSTAAALLIGVTLVSTVAVGAATTQTSLLRLFDRQWPVDVSVGGTDEADFGTAESPPLDAALIAAVTGVDDVADSEQVLGTRAVLELPGQAEGRDLQVHGVDPDRGRAITETPVVLEDLADGTVVVPSAVAEENGITEGQSLTLTRPDGGDLTATAALADLGGWALVVTRDDLAELDPRAPVTRLWIDLDDALATGDPAEAVAAVDRVRDAVSETAAGSVRVEGAAAERASFQQVIDTLLAVLTGLLAVTVLIAVVGVANTLSLSVVERTRESALLRALGLTRRQLRGTLAAEGVLLAGAGTVLGLVLGSLYGWLGAASVLGAVVDGGVQLGLPLGRLGLVVLGAVLAGLLASVLPGRRAAKASPVAALAE